jgi:putative ABC transport system permease protein
MDKAEETLVSNKKDEFFEKNILYADSAFFDVFSFRWIEGNKKEALSRANDIVLTRSAARKFFGEESPIGKNLSLNQQNDFEVVGVIQDVPQNSHFTFDMVVSFESLYKNDKKDYLKSWTSLSYYTYFSLHPDADPVKLESKLQDFWISYIGENIEDHGIVFDPYLQELTAIHLHSNLSAEIEANANIMSIIVLASIALFVLIIASINFMNLSTARSTKRAREVGLRKVSGARKFMLIQQFLGESVITSFFALLISLVFIELLLPFFNNFAGKELSFGIFNSPWLLVFFVFVALLVGVFSGMYPAFYLTRYSPVEVMKGKIRAGTGNIRLRNMLVVIQFAISIVLIISSLMMYKQIRYFKTKKLGFDKENVVVVPLHNKTTKEKASIYKEQLSRNPLVKGVSITTNVPGGGISGSGFFPEGKKEKEPWLIYNYSFDQDYIDVMQMKIVEGRSFSSDRGTDSMAVLINETLARNLRWDKPVGKFLFNRMPGEEDRAGFKVIGIVKDFHNRSLRENIDPMAFFFDEKSANYILVRILPGKFQNTLTSLQKDWNEIFPIIPFDYYFLDESLDKQYKAEKRLGKILLYFTILALFVATLGLFGLTSFVTEVRTKEIGIRKVMGARMFRIMKLFSREFVILMFIANLIAWPIAFFAVKEWMKNYAFKTTISIDVFIFSAMFTLVLALVTINIQALKAGYKNPVDALRYE